eukprot:CCRYP_001173-RD/>CCRYP_001173-RD protein AED:0.46 eAED:1.00 QI:0/-1/0/1/-1/0/1/0/28
MSLLLFIRSSVISGPRSQLQCQGELTTM